MKIDSLRDLQLFLAVSRTRNMSEAGRQLGMSPAQVSKRLQQLEAGLDAHLFYRSTRQLSLSAAGEQLLPYAEKALALLQEAEALITQPEQLSGRLRLTTPVSFGKKYVLPLVARFMAAYPRVQVQLHLDDLTQPLVEQGFDLAIRFGELPDSRLVAQGLFASRRVLCAAPAYLARAGTPTHPADLQTHRCLVLNQQDQWRFQREGQEVNVSVSGLLSVNSGELVCEMALAGWGIGLLSLWHIQEELASGALVPVLQDWELQPLLRAWLVAPSAQMQSPPVRRFMAEAREALRPLGKLGFPESAGRPAPAAAAPPAAAARETAEKRRRAPRG